MQREDEKGWAHSTCEQITNKRAIQKVTSNEMLTNKKSQTKLLYVKNNTYLSYFPT
jgi:hypothetical protein